MKKQYDTLTIGHISLDFNIDYKDNLIIEVGGAVIYSSASAYAGGYRVGVVT
ncbi:MAG: ribokinase, partial [Clostridia bacterium]|nr:ribokinase [Clostridia bacterium]